MTDYKGFQIDGEDGVYCVPGDPNACFPSYVLRGKPEEGSFHDQNLEDATVEINKILDRVRHTEPNRELAIIAAPDGLFLVWVKEGIKEDVLRHYLRTEPPPK
jgi:hypothetical protein